MFVSDVVSKNVICFGSIDLISNFGLKRTKLYSSSVVYDFLENSTESS